MPRARAEMLERARLDLGLSVTQLWLDYIGLGGNLAPPTVEHYLRGEANISEYDHDVLVHALNEHFMEAGDGRRLKYLR